MRLAITATLLASASAKVLLAVGPNGPLSIGDTYDVEWLVDNKMSLELWLVKKMEGGGWESITTIFEGVESKPCNGSYTVKIDDTFPIGGDYGFWLNGQNIPDDGTGYADVSDWFEIQAAGAAAGGDDELRLA